MTVDVPLTDPQRAFCLSQKPRPAIVGGLGSGKSRAGTFRAVLKLIERRGNNIGYYMPTYDLLKLRAIPGVLEDLRKIGLSCTVNMSDYAINVKGYGSIIFRSYDRPERIIAYEVAHSIVDELDTLTKDKAAHVWRKINERNRQNCGTRNSIGAVTTPDQGVSGFMYDRWVKRADDDHVLIKAPTTSNPFLPESYVDDIRANYDPILAELYINGDFVSLSQNKVYHFFDRKQHDSKRAIRDGDMLHIGQDFNIGGCCSTVWVIDDGMPIAVDEFVSHDTQDLCNNIAKRYKSHKVTVYPDASGQASRTNASRSDVDIIKSNGIPVAVDARNPSVRDRVNAVNALLAHNKMLVNVSKCPELTNALEVQGYAKNGEPEKFDQHPAVDDWNDCAGYFIHKRFPIARPVHAPQFRMFG